jgi:hypothetical protein
LPSASFRFDYPNPNTGGLLRRLPIGVAAIPDAEDIDRIFVLLIEKIRGSRHNATESQFEEA